MTLCFCGKPMSEVRVVARQVEDEVEYECVCGRRKTEWRRKE